MSNGSELVFQYGKFHVWKLTSGKRKPRFRAFIENSFLNDSFTLEAALRKNRKAPALYGSAGEGE